jgi:hypothetical protein
MTPPALGTSASRWLAVFAVTLACMTMLESAIGHYRSGWLLRAQLAPIVAGSLLALAGISAGAAPNAAAVRSGLELAGWIAIVTGVIGVGYHHYYGIVEKAGGYRWLRHYMLYGAPQLAPLSLSAAGALAILAAYGMADSTSIAGLPIHRALLALVALTFVGAMAQAGILHYRGAFNTPAMYAPLLLPPLAILGTAWLALAPNAAVVAATRVVLWATIVLGFAGLGFHLRGLDRQMGGAHVFVFNLLQGPPPLAPAVFAVLAAIALLGLGTLGVA